jgi:hypothetical protein
VSSFSAILPQGAYANNGAVNFTSISFCNFSLSYTHPGENDTINVQAWLPTDTWNGRMQNVGGGGWYAGMSGYAFLCMTGAIGDGYMTLTTDGGHSNGDPRDWALVSPGNINLYVLQDFASISLNDLAFIGKSLALSFYGNPQLIRTGVDVRRAVDKVSCLPRDILLLMMVSLPRLRQSILGNSPLARIGPNLS